MKDKGSDSTREMTVDREWIDTIVGLQTGALEKVETARKGLPCPTTRCRMLSTS